MDYSDKKLHEDLLISNFILKKYRDRYYALLKTTKGRKKLQQRLAHEFDVDFRFSTKIPAKEQNIKCIYNLLKNKNAPDICYIFSEHSTANGVILPLKEALTNIVGSGIAAIISCIPGQLAFLEQEEEGERYIFERK